eukprot:CAMPEP_0183388376 /NCGR_PEP_ID=MMETSP0370-20130417/4009_1 /TAXON_ID=268820 /ORGANISM="Peridinium aciculiferum, Strain PAER-2" /LENGTH=97 /DNA_ID=CAMNT_0025567291 /DNA_START=246 /DNA_END=535 /DNA_ORIENTATION=-
MRILLTAHITGHSANSHLSAHFAGSRRHIDVVTLPSAWAAQHPSTVEGAPLDRRAVKIRAVLHCLNGGALRLACVVVARVVAFHVPLTAFSGSMPTT